ncbi:alpha/beta hydrolase [Gordonia McavH-238-E]|nr:alpha/beta hydrolase [Gordonia sp. McavH-238-E]
MEFLASHRRVVCVDLLGTGRSDKPLTGYSTQSQAQLVDDTLRARGIDEFALIGHSFGGMVAFSIAATSPESVERLILVSSNGVRAARCEQFPFGPPGDRMLSALVDAERSARAASRRRTLAAGFATPPKAHVLDFLAGIFMAMPSWSAIASYEEMFATDFVPLIERLTMPVAQIVGDLDRVHPVAGARWLQERLPDGVLEVIPDVGHYPMLESPLTLNAFLGNSLGLAPS